MFNLPPNWWDPHSCQPYKLDAKDKPRFGGENLVEYCKVLGGALLNLPRIAAKYAGLKAAPANVSAKDFVGLSVSAGTSYDTETVELVEELGVQHLLVRVPAWEAEAADRYAEFITRFPERTFCVNILQSRDSVADVGQWRRQLGQILSVASDQVETVWIGNAINRSKWGCRHSGDYLRLQAVAEELRSAYPGLRFIGSSVIDFEPLVSWRTLWNSHAYELDVVGAQLYVNRRGSPYNRQYGLFDLERKLRLLKALCAAGKRNADHLWITETNWPLLDTRPYTPNSGHPDRTVDEPTQAEYLKLYYQIAWQTGWVERIYWWQLINPGYGLVDSRGESLRKMPSWYAFKEILDGELSNPPAAA